MSLRKQKEAFAQRIISYYENEGGRDRRKTCRHFHASENVCRSTVYGVIKRFLTRKEKTYRKISGRKATESTPENLKRIEEVLQVNPTISIMALAKQLNLGKGTVHNLIREIRKRDVNQKDKRDEAECVVVDMSESLEPGTSCKINNSERAEDGDSLVSCGSPTLMAHDNVPSDSDAHEDTLTGSSEVCGASRSGQCFICDAMNAGELDLTFPSLTATPKPGPAEVEKSAGVIGFLKNVMGMGNDDLVNLMKETGGKCPNQWNISVCADPGCRGSVEKVLSLWGGIKKLEANLRKRRQEILGRIRNCLQETGSKDDCAVLNDRVRELAEIGSRPIEWEMEDPSEPVVKMEPQGENTQGLTDASWDNDWGEEWDPQDSTVKVESNDKDSLFRRSTRTKRKPQKLKYDVTSPGKAHRQSELKTKEPSNGKGALHSSSQNGRMMYSCQSCPTLEAMDVDKFIAHVAFHSRHPQKCSECNFYFASDGNEEQVRKHWEERHPESQSTSPKVIQVPPSDAAGKIWLCSRRPKCKEQFASSEERNAHELTVHGIEPSVAKGKFNCCLCPSSKLKNLQELRLHKAIHHPDDAMLSCCYCATQFEVNSEKEGIKFLNLEKLKEHISQKHPDQVNINAEKNTVRFLQTCPHCGLVFSCINHYKLDKHIAREHGQNLYETYTCPICDKKMRYADAWKHTKILHWPDAPRKYICQFCGKGFRQDQTRVIHEQIHSNQEARPYQCELCGSSFAVSTYLYIHRKVTHQGHVWPSVSRKRKNRSRNDALPDSEKNLDMNEMAVEKSRQGQNPEINNLLLLCPEAVF